MPKSPKRITRKPQAAAKKELHEQPANFSYRGNRLAQLRAFVATAKLGTLTRAAAALGLSQPSISLQLSALERELGCALLLRGRRRRIALTPAGQALFELARPLVDGLAEIDAQFHARPSSHDAARELRIAAGATVIGHLLPAPVRMFRRTHPGIRLQLTCADHDERLALLRTGGADIAIGSLPDVPADLCFTPLREADPILIMPHEHPLAASEDIHPRDLATHGLILPLRRRSAYRMIDLVFRQHGLDCRVAQQVDDWELIKHYVAMGLGISIVSDICLNATDRKRLATCNLRKYFPAHVYGAITRRGVSLSPQAQALMELIEAE